MAAISQSIFWNENLWLNFEWYFTEYGPLGTIDNNPALVQNFR